MTPTRLAAAALLSLAACAGPSRDSIGSAPTPLAPDAQKSAAPSPSTALRALDPVAFAAQFDTAADCESAARIMHRSVPADGWSALKGCVERGWKRGDFSMLGALLSPAWIDDMRTRPDASWILARVVAARGGDIEGDLMSIQKARVPIFSLKSAIAQPNTYKGRFLLLRGQLGDARNANDQLALLLTEYTLRPVDGKERTEKTWGRESSYNARGGYSNSGSSWSGGASGNSSTQWTYSERTRKEAENTSQPTGRLAIGKLAKDDPFLERGRDFVFLVRFDGVRSDEDKNYAVVSVIQYFAPNPLVMD